MSVTPIAKVVGKKPVRRQPKPKPKVIRNRIALVIDVSGSMNHVREEARQAVNAMLETVRTKSNAEKQQTEIAIVEFDDLVSTLVRPTDSAQVKPLTKYRIAGSTALYDGIGAAVNTIDDADPDASYLVVVFTDGGENASRQWTKASIANLISQKQKAGNWTFALQVPNGYSRYISDLGIPQENVTEWEATREGTKTMGDVTTSGLGTYFDARSKGLRSVETFYAPVDMSKVKVKDVKNALDDQSDRFKSYVVDKEEDIKAFVERKTGKPYVIGSAFYQLSKAEKVQPTKSVLVVEKGKKAVWGGSDARQLIGLPTDGVSHAKVDPYNLACFEIYIASTSTNRKLVRGTRLLVDVNKTKDDKPTWTAD